MKKKENDTKESVPKKTQIKPPVIEDTSDTEPEVQAEENEKESPDAAEEATVDDIKKSYHTNRGFFGRVHDETLEFFDVYSNLDVGTAFDTSYRSENVGFYSEREENYTFVVDLDDFEYHKIGFHGFLGTVLQSAFFRFSILLLVLANAILIGINTHQETVRNRKAWFQALDQIIFSVFLFEIILKWFHDFRLFWAVWWNVLDFIIVILITLSSMVPFIADRKELFAMIRVIRAFRILRSVSSLTSLNIVTHTMVKSIGDMLNILFVLILFMFVLAIAGVTLFDLPELETEHFQTTFDAWYVLFVCVTQDGWVTILDEFRPDAGDHNIIRAHYFVYVSIFLILGVIIGAFVFTNLIVAVVVANLEMAVMELRAERLLLENPLEYHGEFSAQIIEVLSVYTVLAQDNDVLIGQRPMKIPDLRNISPRMLQTYITLVVALEQNMLEYSLIYRDLRKVMGVILSIAKQLERGQDEAEKPDNAKSYTLTTDYLKNLKLPRDADLNKAHKISFTGLAKDNKQVSKGKTEDAKKKS